MSKAFTNEDDSGELPILPRPTALLPPGAKNLLTKSGAQELQAELVRLLNDKRPPLVAQPDDPDSKRELLMLDQRVFYLQESLRTAEIVEPPPPPYDTVRFGASVTVQAPGGAESKYRIVGVDEADFDRGWVSWVSPVARALLNARVGQSVAFQTPRGLSELKITALTYD